jgi:septal ring factor EnvC (AmiA/AmiB activator)
MEDARREAAEAEAARQAALDAQRAAEQRAAAARATLTGLSAQRAEALAKLRGAERNTLEAADRMAELDRDEGDAQAALAARAAEIAPLLPLIERLSLFPSETLLAVPAPPDQAARGLVVLQGVTRRLEQEATALRADQNRLAEARIKVAAESPVLARARSEQEQAAEELDQQIAATQLVQTAAEQEAEKEAARAADFAARSTNLHALLDRLQATRRRAELEAERTARAARRLKEKPAPPAEAAAESAAPAGAGTPAGAMILPVAGRIVRNWGSPTAAGPAEGISFRAAPGARAVSPCSGQVAFAAPFRSYGKLLILTCGHGLDAVLAGFAELSVHPGQNVRRGDPIGTMPDWSPASKMPRPTLYVEIRRHGDPVDPGPLLKPS